MPCWPWYPTPKAFGVCSVNKQERQQWGEGNYRLPSSLFLETQTKKTTRQAQSPITGW